MSGVAALLLEWFMVCSVLQSVAVCCSVALCCSIMCEGGSSAACGIIDGMHCVLQCVAVCCSVMPCDGCGN